jgi:FYVE zinc finger
MWVPDAAAKACFLCEKPFHTLLRRRHHCRKCGACVCHDCSKSTAHIPSVDPTHPVRVCDACVAQLLSTA